MIDVVMCLIIFYLLVGKLAMTARVKDLPRSGTGAAEGGGSAVVVDILPSEAPDGQILLAVDGAPGDLEGLEAALRRRAAGTQGSNPEVRIRAGRELPYAKLAPVLGACKRAGLTSVRLVAERRP